MSKYNELTTTGIRWTEFYQLQGYLDSEDDVLRIRYDEEHKVALENGEKFSSRDGSNVTIDISTRNSNLEFALLDKDGNLTEEIVKIGDVKLLLQSLYRYLADRRDAEPSPYPSWSYCQISGNWLAPTPKPDDGLEYYWNEVDLSWTKI